MGTSWGQCSITNDLHCADSLPTSKSWTALGRVSGFLSRAFFRKSLKSCDLGEKKENSINQNKRTEKGQVVTSQSRTFQHLSFLYTWIIPLRSCAQTPELARHSRSPVQHLTRLLLFRSLGCREPLYFVYYAMKSNSFQHVLTICVAAPERADPIWRFSAAPSWDWARGAAARSGRARSEWFPRTKYQLCSHRERPSWFHTSPPLAPSWAQRNQV